MIKALKIPVAIIIATTKIVLSQDAPTLKITPPEHVTDFLHNHCVDCHDDVEQKGNIRLDNLPQLTSKNGLAILGRLEEQLYINAMPPKKRDRDEIDSSEREQVLQWITREHKRLKATSVFQQKLRKPKYANYLSHQKLFSGEIKTAPYSPARRWLISPFIYNQRFKEIMGLDERTIFGQQLRKSFITPFNLSDQDSIQYYDLQILNQGHLSTILANAQWYADKQLEDFLVRNKKAIPKKRHAGGNSWVDEWRPPTDPLIEKILSSKSPPNDETITQLLTQHFQKLLNRKPTETEVQTYLKFTKQNLKISDTILAVRNLLIAVFLEEEIYYRSEFGHGPADRHGRRILAPMEAAYAIAYALTDALPDQQLINAAQNDQLNNKQQITSHVSRLLSNPTQKYPVDLELWHHKYEIENPRILRFFRDFFGYPKARKLFKDQNRYNGHNYHHVANLIVKEADQLLEHWINHDQNVIENILSSPNYFVHHQGDNTKATKKANNTKKDYQKHMAALKGIDWQKDIRQGLIDAGLFKVTNHPATNRRVFNLLKNKTHAAHTSVSKNYTPVPFSRFDFKHSITHTYTYNIDPHDWDYPTVQPSPVPNRAGIVTHPAWLIAHSKNTHNDPVHRGLWIRKKLLAGFVPDVPITVDAVIPEHKDLTLRNRLANATEKVSCWRCHDKMNPLGYPFEQFNDFGQFRTKEDLEHPENIVKKGTLKPNVPNTYKQAPVDPSGALTGTGNPQLDGPVNGAVDLMQRLSKSDIARQSIIRHAFRYFMGRNEMLSDSQTLINADQAYLKSGGSFKAVVLSLLTSDSFLYRK